MRPAELRRLRLQLGLTQAQLAKEIGVAEYTVWRWERGTHKISRIIALGLRAYAASKRRRR